MNSENTVASLSPSSSVQLPSNVRNNSSQGSGGRNNHSNQRIDNVRNNTRQDGVRNDRSGRNRGRLNQSNNSKPNERFSPDHNQGCNSNRRSPIDDDRFYYDDRNNCIFDNPNNNRDFGNPHNNWDFDSRYNSRDDGQFGGRGRDWFYNNQGNYMDNNSR